MKRCIRVECWGDNYFFGRLLENKSLIRKEKNKSEVFKSIKDESRGRDAFAICIVDNDGDDIEPFLKPSNGKEEHLQIENRFFICNEIEIIKIKDKPYFILQLFPKEFEKWIEKYITNHCGKTLIDFGYNSSKEFEEASKVIPEKLSNNKRFLALIDFVLKSCDETENHISKTKTVLKYLIEHTYQADINELKNV
jgi:hypothetical protein